MRVKLIPNPRKDWTEELCSKVASFLSRNGHDIVDRKADATVCIGGDGTILYANHKRRLQGAIAGIGTGTSYICQLRRDSWRDEILPMLDRRRTIRVMSIDAEADGHRFNALNDYVVHSNDYRLIRMEVTAGGRTVGFLGDGLIISSALGSPAYAYSAGGAELPPTDRAISLVPIAPYRRAFSPVMLGEGDKVSVKVRNDCAFIIDGIFVRHLKQGQTVTVKKGSDAEFFEGVGGHR